MQEADALQKMCIRDSTYSAAFLYAVDYSEINIGSSITAASFKNAARVTGKKFHFVSTEIVDSNTRRTLLPGNTAGTYGNGNLINGMATDITVDGTPSDTAVKRGQIGDAVIVSAVSNLNEDVYKRQWLWSLRPRAGFRPPFSKARRVIRAASSIPPPKGRRSSARTRAC